MLAGKWNGIWAVRHTKFSDKARFVIMGLSRVYKVHLKIAGGGHSGL